MELTSPLNTPFTMERQYNLFMFHTFFNVLPFQRAKYVSPYLGAAIGFLYLWDYRINQVYEGNEELIHNQPSLSCAGKLGITLFPISIFRVYIEARYYVQPFPIDRPTYVSQGIGSEMAETSNEIQLNYFALGGGITFTF